MIGGCLDVADCASKRLFTVRAVCRLLDSAQAREWYAEDQVGAAIAASGIAREDLFLVSKVSLCKPPELGGENLPPLIQGS